MYVTPEELQLSLWSFLKDNGKTDSSSGQPSRKIFHCPSVLYGNTNWGCGLTYAHKQAVADWVGVLYKKEIVRKLKDNGLRIRISKLLHLNAKHTYRPSLQRVHFIAYKQDETI